MQQESVRFVCFQTPGVHLQRERLMAFLSQRRRKYFQMRYFQNFLVLSRYYMVIEC